MYYGDLISMSGISDNGYGYGAGVPSPPPPSPLNSPETPPKAARPYLVEPINVTCKQCGHGRKEHFNKPNSIQENSTNNWHCDGRIKTITKQDNGIKRIKWDTCKCNLTHEEIEYNAADISVIPVYTPSDETPLARLK